jgi:hypothetical protein
MSCCVKLFGKKVNVVSSTPNVKSHLHKSPTSKRRSISKNDNRLVERNTTSANKLKPLYDLKDKFRCLFCGRAACKHENWKNHPKTVIIGLNCDQITEDLFAAQRPSTVLIHEYNLIKKFKE